MLYPAQLLYVLPLTLFLSCGNTVPDRKQDISQKPTIEQSEATLEDSLSEQDFITPILCYNKLIYSLEEQPSALGLAVSAVAIKVDSSLSENVDFFYNTIACTKKSRVSEPSQSTVTLRIAKNITLKTLEENLERKFKFNWFTDCSVTFSQSQIIDIYTTEKNYCVQIKGNGKGQCYREDSSRKYL